MMEAENILFPRCWNFRFIRNSISPWRFFIFSIWTSYVDAKLSMKHSFKKKKILSFILFLFWRRHFHKKNWRYFFRFFFLKKFSHWWLIAWTKARLVSKLHDIILSFSQLFQHKEREDFSVGVKNCKWYREIVVYN